MKRRARDTAGFLSALAAVMAVALAACGSDGVTPALTTSDARTDAGGSSDAATVDAPSSDQGGAPNSDAASEGAFDAGASSDRADSLGSVNDVRPGTDATDAPAAESGALRCNGHEALCDRRFNEVVFPATHNAMANADDRWFTPNQEHGLPRQLRDGIRALLLDTYAWQGDLHLCHSLCELGNRLLVDGLRDIATFLRENPNEVLALLIEDHISAADTERAFTQSGLVDFAYVHDRGDDWPTLRQMIASGRRLLVTAESGAPPPAWYHHLWDVAADTPYSFKNAGEFSCRHNRGMPDNDLYLLNHWVENPLPSPTLSRSVNTSAVLLARARQCQEESGKLPNFVAVNHYATSDLFAVVRQLNGLPP